MQRWPIYGRAFPFIDGDRGFQGIDMTRDRGIVAQGMLALGQNSRLRTSRAKQRPGTAVPPDFNPVGGLAPPFVGSGVYRDPNGDESLLVAPAGVQYAWALRYGKDPVQIVYNGGEATSGRTNGTGQVEFVQAFQNVTLHRNPTPVGGVQLVWNGNYDQTATPNKWTPVTLSVDGLVLVPPYFNGEPWGRRIAYYNANATAVPFRDEFILSDLNDYTSYDPVYQDVRVNSAESDYIVRVMSYFQGAMLVFKNQSIFMLTDLGVFPLMIQQRQLSRNLGAVANHMPLAVGADVIFLNEPNGFYRMGEVIEDQVAALAIPISEPIQPIVDQINWSVTRLLGCSAALDNYAFFGVALGPNALSLNTILVYNTQSRQWESAGDTWAAGADFRFHRLHVTNYLGVHRVFALDYFNGFIYLLYEGLRDELYTGSFAVPFKVETRGYTGDDPFGFKKFHRARVTVSTYSPSGVTTALCDGVNEEFQVGVIDKSNSRYYSHGRGPFVDGVDDPNAPFREDYAAATDPNFAGEDFEGLPIGTIAFLPPTSVAVAGPMQQSIEVYWPRQNSRWLSLRIENNSGALDLLAVSLEGSTISNSVRTLA